MATKQLIAVGLLALSSVISAQSYYDTAYVKDYSNRVLVSYFQEYRSFDAQLTPTFNAPTTGVSDSLVLTSPQNLFAGFLLQYKASSIYLAGSVDDGRGNRNNLWRVGIAAPGLNLRAQGAAINGFESTSSNLDSSPVNPSLENAALNWWSIDVKHAPAFRRLAIGIPDIWSLHPVRNKGGLGFRGAFQSYVLKNNNGFFRPDLAQLNQTLSFTDFRLSVAQISAGYIFQLALDQRWFMTGEVWGGVDAIWQESSIQNEQSLASFRAGISVPEVKISAGAQSRNWLFSVYYSLNTLSTQTPHFRVANNLHTAGFIIGRRFNSPARWMF